MKSKKWNLTWNISRMENGVTEFFCFFSTRPCFEFFSCKTYRCGLGTPFFSRLYIATGLRHSIPWRLSSAVTRPSWLSQGKEVNRLFIPTISLTKVYFTYLINKYFYNGRSKMLRIAYFCLSIGDPGTGEIHYLVIVCSQNHYLISRWFYDNENPERYRPRQSVKEVL